jgi:signal transduction histidine kinase/CheY-like chemotaxis protein
VLALMPSAKDGERVAEVLAAAQLQSLALPNLSAVCHEFRNVGAGALLLTEEGVSRDRSGCLGQILEDQPKWSAVPIILLARESSAKDLHTLIPNASFNVTLVEIPLRMRTLISVVQSALRARRQQYEIRDAIVERERQAAELAMQAKELREADRRKDEFLATLAHELRNPLAPIRTGLDVLKRAPDEAAASRTRAMMDRQLIHMVRLIDDLLDVSRITRGRIELQKSPITLRAVIQAAVEASRPHIEAGRHHLSVSLADDQRPFLADATRLAQIVSNLLSNAAKYSPSGGQIEIDAHHEGDEVVIQVRDRGMGILPDKLVEIFEMFSQVNRTLDRAQGGLGIGLALVRRLTEMHGGTVTAQSDGPNQGSTFTVRIPAAPSPPAAEAASDGLTNGRPEVGRILIVDDNIDAAQSLSEFLEMSGHQTRLAQTGQEAIHTARAFRPAIVLLDIGLPGMNGYEVALQLRREPNLSRATLVAVTGWGTSEDKRRALEAGFDYHLTKPVVTEAIEKLIADVLRP